MADNPALNITPARLGFALSIAAAITVGINIVSYFKEQELKDFSQDQKIATIEESVRDYKTSLDRLSGETRDLRIAVVRLTTVMESRADIPQSKNLTGVLTEQAVSAQ
jgi:hypothetical protein